jgi:hypothetical protein
MPTSA